MARKPKAIFIDTSSTSFAEIARQIDIAEAHGRKIVFTSVEPLLGNYMVRRKLRDSSINFESETENFSDLFKIFAKTRASNPKPHKAVEANKEKTKAYVQRISPIFKKIQESGRTTLRTIALELNKQEVKRRNGAFILWDTSSVHALKKKIEKICPD